jgi:hypothetical protein
VFDPCVSSTTEVEPGFSTFGGMLVPVLQLISPVCKTGTTTEVEPKFSTKFFFIKLILHGGMPVPVLQLLTLISPVCKTVHPSALLNAPHSGVQSAGNDYHE